MPHPSPPAAAVARVNGIALHPPGARPDAATLRQLACTELLRQAALAAGLMDEASDDDCAHAAIETLLERELALAEPDDTATRRYHAAHAREFSTGEQLQLAHLLFAVTPGVDVAALRQRAEQVLLELRSACAEAAAARECFARRARELSNCPSAAQGGELGWVRAEDCAPEFARELFGGTETGVLPRLVHSRHGLHVVLVLQRQPGQAQPLEAVRDAVRQRLRQQAWITAVHRYVLELAERADVDGVDLMPPPLVQ